jgi:dihydroorotate dehydrogenase (NAD+) catalytic subunit
MVGSGTFSNGVELSKRFDINKLGAVVSKGTTLRPRLGNPTPRTVETAAGMLNSIGFQNVGLSAVINDYAPRWQNWDTPVVVNIMGENFSEYIELVEALDGISGVAAVEVNISCPNVEAGGLEFGQDPRLAGELIKAIRESVQLPILVKLTPSVADPRTVAASVAKAGADALTIFNTIPGMAIDIERRKPTLGATFGGLSGPAIKPVALRHVFLVGKEMDIPIVASGGIVSGTDVIEFIMAGASAVQVGTATFVRPDAAWQILNELIIWCDSNGIKSLSEIRGVAK